MGGRVILALNVAAFPERMPPEAISAIFSAAAAVVAEAGGVVAGGVAAAFNVRLTLDAEGIRDGCDRAGRDGRADARIAPAT